MGDTPDVGIAKSFEYPFGIVLIAEHPDFQRRGIGKELMLRLMRRYSGFHQHMLVSDGGAVEFYRRCGFRRAGETEPMWVYHATDHD